MSFTFTNIAMLAGLVTIILPVVAHLLSKRRYDVVNWGAMQFLQLGQKTRRRIRFQDLLLLLLRMGLLACLVLALARPNGSGAFFATLGKPVGRDIVFVLDGSGSMGWEGEKQTPHAAGLQWIHTAIEQLNPGDTVAILDARSRNRRLIHPPTSDMSYVRSVLDQVPEPTGRSNLTEAILDALRILSTTNNVTREAVILTDGQAFPWEVDNEFGIQRIDDLLQQPEIPPSVSVVNLSGDNADRSNSSVDKIQLSRELTVPGFPIQFRTTIRQSGGEATQKVVSLAINDQPAPDATRVVNLLPNGEAMVEFEHVFTSTGLFRVTVSIEKDQLHQDDQSEAIIVVQNGVPVVLVNGSANLDETRSDIFFLKSAFAASGESSPWVRSEVVSPSQLNANVLNRNRIAILCDIESITTKQQLELIDFVLAGGGLILAPGESVDGPNWNSFKFEGDVPFLPAEFVEIEKEDLDIEKLVTIESLSLNASWLQRFRKERGVDFWTARFSNWWKLRPYDFSVKDAEQPEQGDENEATQSMQTELIKLTNGQPYMFSRRLGEGVIIQLAAPLDADWSTLPARNDFVPFVHELVFRFAGMETAHNVHVGMPIQVELQEDQRPRDFLVTGPGIEGAIPEFARQGKNNFASFSETSIPGRYTFHEVNAPQDLGIPFVVTDDREESNLTPLNDLAWESLLGKDRMQKIDTMSDLTKRVQAENSQTELWWVLLLFLLAMLIGEVALTRKMLQDGHAELETDIPADSLDAVGA